MNKEARGIAYKLILQCLASLCKNASDSRNSTAKQEQPISQLQEQIVDILWECPSFGRQEKKL
jgi:hypothetical protein